VSEEARATGGAPVWELVERWLKAHPAVGVRRPNTPGLVGVEGNPGIAQ